MYVAIHITHSPIAPRFSYLYYFLFLLAPLPSSNFFSSSCFPLFPLIIAYLAVISYLDKLVQPSYLLCTQFILAFLLNYLTLLSSFCLFFLAFASLAISLSITKVPEWQLPQQVWLSHFLSFEKCLVLSFVWGWARSVLIFSARPQPQTWKQSSFSRYAVRMWSIIFQFWLSMIWILCNGWTVSYCVHQDSTNPNEQYQLSNFCLNSFIGEKPSTITGLTSFPSPLYPSCQHWSIIITPDPGSITRNFFQLFTFLIWKSHAKFPFRPTTSPNGRTPDFCFSFSFPV